jgi:phosphatidylglycerophosphatase B
LLAPALAAWVVRWRWEPGDGAWIASAVAVTNTAGFPYAIATSVILAALFVLSLKLTRPRAVLAFVLLCTVAIGFGQGMKSLLKNTFEAPRPYVGWIGRSHGLESAAFYGMPRSARAAWIEKELAQDARVPAVLREHWQRETGFSFPSGHTSFVATWAMLAGALLWPRGRGSRVLCCAVVAWALAVEATRMVLGMHWPRDVAAQVLLSWLTVAVLVAIWQKQLTPLHRNDGL